MNEARPLGPSTPAMRQCGYSLIEALCVMGLLGILATLAWPGYQQHLRRAHRISAQSALLALAAAQERHRLEHPTYAVSLDRDAEPPGLPFDNITTDGRYGLAVEFADAVQFIASAAPLPGPQQRDRQCATFRIDASGRRTALALDGSDTTAVCWR